MSVLVVTEHHRGTWHRISMEAVAAGQQAAQAMRCSLAAAVVGSDVGGLASDLAHKRVSEVVAIDHPQLAAYSADGFAAALSKAIDDLRPRLVLFPHTYQVRDLAPKLAASVGTAFVSDAVGMRFEGGEPIFVRQMFQGKLHADVAPRGAPPHIRAVRSVSGRVRCGWRRTCPGPSTGDRARGR